MELTRGERWLAWLWLIATIWTAIAFFATGLASLITFILLITIIGIPLIALLPTVFLYMTAAAPIYLLLRRRSRLIGGVFSVLFVGSLAIVLPTVANRTMSERAEAATVYDGGELVKAQSGSVIAFLSGYGPAIGDGGCDGYCQRLIFSGVARAVIRGNVDALKGKRTELWRYWIGPAKGKCRPAKMTPDRAEMQDIGSYLPPPLLQQKAQQAYREGKCFFQAKAALGEADLILAQDNFVGTPLNRRPAIQVDFRPPQVSQSWVAIYSRSGAGHRQVMKATHILADRLAVPLRLEAPFQFDTYTPGHWTTNGRIERGRAAEYGLSAFLTNDVRVRGLTTETGEPIPPTSR